MTHVGEKLALGTVGSLRRRLDLQQDRLGPLAFGDVAKEDHDPSPCMGQ